MLGECELGEWLSVVGLCCRLKPVGAVPKKHAVDIQLKYFFLAQSRFDLQGQQYLGEFPDEGLIKRQKVIARHLHGERRTTAALFSRQQQLRDSSGEAQHLHAAMLKEAVVLCRQQRVDETLWNLLKA